MNTVKNLQFDFTTIGSNNQVSNCPTFRSMKPQLNMDSIARQYLDQKKQQNLRKTIDKPHSKLNFNLSQIRSDTSFSSIPIVEEIDTSETLVDLQQRITQQILILRQQKLTLMQEHNIATQNRFKIQRQLNKIKKKRQIMKNSGELQTEHSYEPEQSPLSNHEQVMQKQEGRDEKMKEEQHMITRISNIQSSIKQLQREIVEIESKSNKDTQHSQVQNTNTNHYVERFSSFCQSNRKDFAEVSRLRCQKQKLLNRMVNQTEKIELRSCLMMIMKSNQDLQAVLDDHFYRQQHMVDILKQKIKVEESEKLQLLEDLVTIKSKSKHLRLENQELRKALRLFRF